MRRRLRGGLEHKRVGPDQVPGIAAIAGRGSDRVTLHAGEGDLTLQATWNKHSLKHLLNGCGVAQTVASQRNLGTDGLVARLKRRFLRARYSCIILVLADIVFIKNRHFDIIAFPAGVGLRTHENVVSAHMKTSSAMSGSQG